MSKGPLTAAHAAGVTQIVCWSMRTQRAEPLVVMSVRGSTWRARVGVVTMVRASGSGSGPGVASLASRSLRITARSHNRLLVG